MKTMFAGVLAMIAALVVLAGCNTTQSPQTFAADRTSTQIASANSDLSAGGSPEASIGGGATGATVTTTPSSGVASLENEKFHGSWKKIRTGKHGGYYVTFGAANSSTPLVLADIVSMPSANDTTGPNKYAATLRHVGGDRFEFQTPTGKGMLRLSHGGSHLSGIATLSGDKYKITLNKTGS